MPVDNRNAGALRDRLHFQLRGDADDGLGTMIGTGDFETRFTVWAGLQPLRGSEAVMGARMQGQQPHIVTVRQTSQTRQVTTAWQLVDARNETRVFAVTAPPTDPDGKRAWLEILVVEGKLS